MKIEQITQCTFQRSCSTCNSWEPPATAGSHLQLLGATCNCWEPHATAGSHMQLLGATCNSWEPHATAGSHMQQLGATCNSWSHMQHLLSSLSNSHHLNNGLSFEIHCNSNLKTILWRPWNSVLDKTLKFCVLTRRVWNRCVSAQ
jgi:hypothetical protein